MRSAAVCEDYDDEDDSDNESEDDSDDEYNEELAVEGFRMKGIVKTRGSFKKKKPDVNKKRLFNEAKKYIDMDANSEDEDEEKVKGDKTDQYYQPGILEKKTN